MGLTTTEDLLNEISIINPDVIFEEIPVNMFSDIYTHRSYPDTTEVSAVRKYIEKNSNVDHFPID